jgi:hypothetical protein
MMFGAQNARYKKENWKQTLWVPARDMEITRYLLPGAPKRTWGGRLHSIAAFKA